MTKVIVYIVLMVFWTSLTSNSKGSFPCLGLGFLIIVYGFCGEYCHPKWYFINVTGYMIMSLEFVFALIK